MVKTKLTTRLKNNRDAIGITNTNRRENTDGIIIENAFRASSTNENILALLFPLCRSTIVNSTYSTFSVNFDRYILRKGFGSSYSITPRARSLLIKQNSLVPETYFLPEINLRRIR
jgi:hypothetical protein